MTLWQDLLVQGSGFVDYFLFEFGRRSAVEWIFYFAPILIFLEIPTYYLPVAVVLISNRLGYPKTNWRRAELLWHQAPKISVVVAGRNEEETIDAAICSLMDQDYPNYEIIIVDDHSDDRMSDVARRYVDGERVRLIRNRASTGRTGKPSALNLGFRLARGEFIVALDADTTFDRRMLQNLIAPFADPRVGAVAGNVLVRNRYSNFLTRIQTFEYLAGFDIRRRWTDLLHSTLQISGAIGAFRRSVLLEISGMDQEVADDTDISLRILKTGRRIAFAADAVALTEVPSTWRGLFRQRHRWERSSVRTYFMKHWRLLRPSSGGPALAFEMWSHLFFSVIICLVYPVYIVWLLSKGLYVYLFVMAVCTSIYAVLSLAALLALGGLTDRISNPMRLFPAALLTPIYKGVLRWVRFRAIVMELLRVRYADAFLPETAWNNAPRY
jgi:cellulose synthase/poly-beta-1,6-N-acetylglucosamine synthase-like glycosyltransferase